MSIVQVLRRSIMRVKLSFDFVVDVEHIVDVDILGKELSTMLLESMDNGEDYLEVNYTGSDIVK